MYVIYVKMIRVNNICVDGILHFGHRLVQIFLSESIITTYHLSMTCIDSHANFIIFSFSMLISCNLKIASLCKYISININSSTVQIDWHFSTVEYMEYVVKIRWLQAINNILALHNPCFFSRTGQTCYSRTLNQLFMPHVACRAQSRAPLNYHVLLM